MKRNFTFWAQSLDNVSPDHFEIDGQPLADSDVAGRQGVVTQIARIAEKGAMVFQEGGVSLTVSRDGCVVEAYSNLPDQAGRIAPIVGLIKVDYRPSPSLGDAVSEAMRSFALSIGRDLKAGHDELVRNAFSVKFARRGTRFPAWVVLAIITFIVIALVLIR